MVALNDITWVFLAIIGLFYGGLLLKTLVKLNVCTICLAVSLTWLTLLALRALGWFDNDLILALLLGQSVVGGYYLWERRVKADWLIFRLPVLLTLTFVAWSLLLIDVDPALLGLVAAIWIVHNLLYTYRTRPGVKSHVDKLLACCGRW